MKLVLANKTNLALCIYIINKSDNTATAFKNELALLSDTAGYDVFRTLEYRQSAINSATYISRGHLEEIIESINELDIKYLIFDNELSASQISNLEKMTKIAIRTRTEVILEIFKRNAKTKIAKMQVELALLEFEYPKLKGKWSHLSRIEGGIAIRGGPGETQLEYDRRRVRDRIFKMKKSLANLEKSVTNSMKSREFAFRISLVGYTNAGKSSMFNLLCKSDNYVENKLFATLDTKTKKLFLSYDINDIILSDTVGFIDRLPHSLVASFKSTLSEVSYSDLIIHLVDASEDISNIEKIMSSVETVLDEISASEIKSIIVFNKIDLIDDEKLYELKSIYNNAIFVSTKDKQNIDVLKESIIEIYNNARKK